MMAKHTLWQWVFNLLGHRTDTHEPSKPMAVPNNPARGRPLTGSADITEDEWNEQCDCSIHPGLQAMSSDELQGRALRQVEGMRNARMGLVAGQAEGMNISQQQALEQLVRSGNHPFCKKWESGIGHSQPLQVKENPDGTLYYKGQVYRLVVRHDGIDTKEVR